MSNISKFLRPGIASLILIACSSGAMAAEQIYVTIDGLKFQVVNETFMPGKFEALSAAFDMKLPLNQKGSPSIAASRRVVGPLTMKKYFGAGSTLGLVTALENGESLKTVNIDFTRQERDTPVLLRTFRLSNAVVLGYEFTGEWGGDRPIETVTLGFQTLEIIVGGKTIQTVAIRADR